METATEHPDRILFGSCNSQHYEPVLWPSILSRNASAFVWVGDAIYADDFASQHWFPTKRVPLPATPEVLRRLYNDLLHESGYRELLEGNMTVLGTLDDHDYGCNNGDKNYQFRRESAMAYVEFLQAQQSDVDLSRMARRAATGRGVFGVKVLDFSRSEPLLSDEEAGIEPGTHGTGPLSNESVAIFLLDIRSNKDPWLSGRKRFSLDYEADFLGEEQWKWFEAALQASSARVNVVVQGLQVHAGRFFDGSLSEDWSRFPMSQHRLYQTILQSGVSAPILVSGDVHMAELLRKDCKQGPDFAGPSRMLLEVTTSGMTHSWGTHICAIPHLHPACQSRHFRWFVRSAMHLAHGSGSFTDLVHVPDPLEGAKRGSQFSLARNFGEFEFDWAKRRVVIRVLGENVGEKPLLSTAWDLDLLSGWAAPVGGKLSESDFRSRFQVLSAHGAKEGDWICIEHLGRPTTWHKLYGIAFPAALMLAVPLLIPALLVCFLNHTRWRI